MLSQLEAWMFERVDEIQQTHFEASKVTIDQYTSGWNSSLKKLKRESASTVSRPVVLTDDLKELFASLDGSVNIRGQAETGPTDRAEMRSPGAADPGADDPETDNPGADN